MSTKAMTARRWATTATLAAGGAAVTLAAWVGGEPYLAVALAVIYVGCCGVAFLWSRGSGDVAALIRLTGDERQRLIDLRATAVAGLATLAFCLGGAIVDLARGGTGNPWALICAIGGLAYVVTLAILRRR
jgi:hypothetical protein